jgi:hypothetical protein
MDSSLAAKEKQMSNIRNLMAGIFIALALTVTQIGSAAAQSGTPVPPWTVNAITLQTDPITGEVTGVVLDMTDDMGNPQTVSLTLAEAEALGLVTTDPITGDVTTNDVTQIDPASLPTGGGTPTDEPQHPVGSKLSDFFNTLLGVDYDTIMTAHDDGFGFGVIAQTLWMTNQLEGDSATFQAILDAKQSGDYSALLDCDNDCPTNWGQFKQEAMHGDKGNLGCVMSGKTENCLPATEVPETALNSAGPDTNVHDNGNDNNNGKGNGQDKGKDKNKDKSNGKGNGHP